ncbi:MAG: hypothetical protein NTX00_02300 [Candidatus Parcubacteria bacterium]|nr:hypothetical protein [Candidatus Parcubacteria bacterium]
MKIFLIEIPGFGIVLMRAESLKEVEEWMEEMEFEDRGRTFKADLKSIMEVKFEGHIKMLISRLDPIPFQK